MKIWFGILLVSLIFCPMFSDNMELVNVAKERRGWTLNSAGYLLGPHGIDGHRTLGEKTGLAGKRDMDWEEYIQTGGQRKREEDIVHSIIDFLSYLKFKGSKY
ncbi:galanin peptides isoform X2 [Stigmatopora argus]